MFHITIGEFHLDSLPIAVMQALYEKMIADNPNAKIALCLEVNQENTPKIQKDFADQKSISDSIYQAAQTGADDATLLPIVQQQMQKMNLSLKKGTLKEFILRDLAVRNRTLAYNDFCEFVGKRGIELYGIDFQSVPGTPEEDAVLLRSMHMFQRLTDLQKSGYSTLFVVGQEHLIDLKEFLKSVQPPQLLNCHFFSVDSNAPVALPGSFSVSLKGDCKKWLDHVEQKVKPDVVAKLN